MVTLEVLENSPDETESQLPPEVVAALVVNETADPETDVVKLTDCVKGVVEPAAADGVQAAGLGVTVGGAAPEAEIVPLSVKAVVRSNREEFAVTRPLIFVEGMFAGTFEIKLPSGTVALADKVASGVPAKEIVQLLIATVSGAPTLSVMTNVSGGVVVVEQGKAAAPNFEIESDTEIPLV